MHKHTHTHTHIKTTNVEYTAALTHRYIYTHTHINVEYTAALTHRCTHTHTHTHTRLNKKCWGALEMVWLLLRRRSQHEELHCCSNWYTTLIAGAGTYHGGAAAADHINISVVGVIRRKSVPTAPAYTKYRTSWLHSAEESFLLRSDFVRLYDLYTFLNWIILRTVIVRSFG